MELKAIFLDGAEAKKEVVGQPKNIAINIRINAMALSGDELKFKFTYEADYQPNIGFLRITGIAVATDKLAAAKEIFSRWQKDKTIAPEIASPLINAINMNAGMNSLFVARALNMSPPFLPPKLDIGKVPTVKLKK